MPVSNELFQGAFDTWTEVQGANWRLYCRRIIVDHLSFPSRISRHGQCWNQEQNVQALLLKHCTVAVQLCNDRPNLSNELSPLFLQHKTLKMFFTSFIWTIISPRNPTNFVAKQKNVTCFSETSNGKSISAPAACTCRYPKRCFRSILLKSCQESHT